MYLNSRKRFESKLSIVSIRTKKVRILTFFKLSKFLRLSDATNIQLVPHKALTSNLVAFEPFP